MASGGGLPLAPPVVSGKPTLSAPGTQTFGIQSDTVGVNPDVLVETAKVHHQAGRLAQAEEIYHRVLAIEPGHASSLHLLGLIRHQQGRSQEALEFISNALRANPKDAEAHNNKGNVLRRLGRATEAIGSFKRAIKMMPGFAGAYSNLALTYRQLGNLELAAKNYRLAIRKNPLSAEAWHGLTSSGRLALEDEEVEGAKKALEIPNLSPSDRRHICFALGKHYDSMREWDRAFGYYAKANEFTESPDRHKIVSGIFTTMLDAPVDFLDRAHLPEDEEPWTVTPVFVVGMPRSGTTLVDQILFSHPDAQSGGETNLIDAEMRRVLHECQSTGNPLESCLTADRLLGMRRTFKQYVAEFLEREGGNPTHFVDKSLMNLAYVPILRKLFPDARIVMCRRNPLDTGVSIYFTDFKQTYDYTTSLAEIGEVYCYHVNLLERWQAMCDDSILEIQYENFLDDQEKETKRLLDFCGLPWNAACLTFFETKRQVATPSDWQVRQPIFSTSRNRWKNYEAHLSDLIDALKACI